MVEYEERTENKDSGDHSSSDVSCQWTAFAAAGFAFI